MSSVLVVIVTSDDNAEREVNITFYSDPSPAPTPAPTPMPVCESLGCDTFGFGRIGSTRWCSCCFDDCGGFRSDCERIGGFCTTQCVDGAYGCTVSPTTAPSFTPSSTPTSALSQI
mmetsp:Transcript_3772/g.9055  ORF Transcript_3772/g.9055 Transcript_3772/m.9055 type:complete len:116 (-) Transcript_3772:161-508(-)